MKTAPTRPKSRPASWLGLPLLVALQAPALAGGGGDDGPPVLSLDAALAQEDGADDSFWGAVTGGKSWLKMRYRFENVDQGGFSKDAHASTLRTVLGYETGVYHGLRALIELEDVSVLGDEGAYASPNNGVGDRPGVADPEGGEINQAYLDCSASERLTGKIGRQRIVLDNARFVGNVGWRQNEQTFDALTLRAPKVAGCEVFYGFVHNVNRVFGDDVAAGDHSMFSHLLNVSRPVGAAGKLTVYDYYLDYESVNALSTNTVGVRLAGRRDSEGAVDLDWLLEFAHQTDTGDNPNDVEAEYWRAELGAGHSGVSLHAGVEVLGGSGATGDKFTTPLATGHAFNGWADRFLVTPDDGLEDYFMALGTQLAGNDLQAVFHHFASNDTNTDFGKELDLVATRKVNEHVTVGAKFASYNKEDLGPNIEKFWLWLALSF